MQQGIKYTLRLPNLVRREGVEETPVRVNGACTENKELEVQRLEDSREEKKDRKMEQAYPM